MFLHDKEGRKFDGSYWSLEYKGKIICITNHKAKYVNDLKNTLSNPLTIPEFIMQCLQEWAYLGYITKDEFIEDLKTSVDCQPIIYGNLKSPHTAFKKEYFLDYYINQVDFDGVIDGKYAKHKKPQYPDFPTNKLCDIGLCSEEVERCFICNKEGYLYYPNGKRPFTYAYLNIKDVTVYKVIKFCESDQCRDIHDKCVTVKNKMIRVNSLETALDEILIKYIEKIRHKKQHRN